MVSSLIIVVIFPFLIWNLVTVIVRWGISLFSFYITILPCFWVFKHIDFITNLFVLLLKLNVIVQQDFGLSYFEAIDRHRNLLLKFYLPQRSIWITLRSPVLNEQFIKTQYSKRKFIHLLKRLNFIFPPSIVWKTNKIIIDEEDRE